MTHVYRTLTAWLDTWLLAQLNTPGAVAQGLAGLGPADLPDSGLEGWLPPLPADGAPLAWGHQWLGLAATADPDGGYGSAPLVQYTARLRLWLWYRAQGTATAPEALLSRMATLLQQPLPPQQRTLAGLDAALLLPGRMYLHAEGLYRHGDAAARPHPHWRLLALDYVWHTTASGLPCAPADGLPAAGGGGGCG